MNPARGRALAPLLLVGLTAASSAGCSLLNGPDGDDLSPVSVTAVREDLVITVPAIGELTAMKASPVAVPRVPTGALKVKELTEEGSIVDEGEVVVVFDDSQLNIEMDNHRASFRSADRRIDGTGFSADIDSGNVEVMRQVAELERDNVVAFGISDGAIYSRREILGDEVRKDDADATILFADASLLLKGEYYDIEERILEVEKGQVSGKIERVEYSLGNLVLKAPIGGLIVYKKNWRGSSAAVGDSLWPGNVIMSIVDPMSTALRGYVLERDAAGLSEGAKATLIVDAWPERTLLGKVIKVAELSRPIERGSPVKYTEVTIEILDGDRALLKPGMKGEARIASGRFEQAIVIPRSAVRHDEGGSFVIVLGPNGREKRPVQLGAGDLVRVSIEQGLQDGERVVLGGSAEGLSEPATDEIAALTGGS